MFQFSISGYNKLVRITLVIIYLLIVAGGVVRCTGSGMGCPDWPKCFGMWIPPTEVSQLPINYQEIYSSLGYHSTEFNVSKTWTEYLNRLLGAISGFMVLISFIYSLFLKNEKSKMILACITLLLIGFQGWLGAKVVSTNLAPYMITIHMFFALVIVIMLIYSLYISSKFDFNKAISLNNSLVTLAFVVFLITFLQILLGTQVRKEVDITALFYNNMNRDLWIDRLGIKFLVHRSFSIVVLGLNIYLFQLIFKSFTNGLVRFLGILNLASIVLIIFSGIGLNYFNIPSWIQPIHLLLSSIIFGVQFYLFVHLSKIKSLELNVQNHG